MEVALKDNKLPVVGIIDGVDLTVYQGHRPTKIRVVRERDGSISIDPEKGYWLESEVDIPAKQFVEKPVLDAKTAKPVLDEYGQAKVELVAAPIDSVKVRTWEH